MHQKRITDVTVESFVVLQGGGWGGFGIGMVDAAVLHSEGDY